MMGNSMVGNWMGHCMVGNRVGHCMGDRVSQEANTMVSWCVVDCGQVVDSMVGSVVNCRSSMMHKRGSMVHKWCRVVHNRGSMVEYWGSVVHNRGSMVHKWCSMVHNRGSVVHKRGSMVHKWCSMVHKRCSMVHKRCSMVHNWGSMVHNWGSVVYSRSMVHNWCSITWGLSIDCLSSVSHFLDHSISTIVVSHSLHSSIGQGDGVRAGGGVAISGLLLLEVCSAVAVVDPVLVGICRRLAQVLVGQLRSWGSQATADKGQQQDHLGGEGFGGASGKGGREIMLWTKVRGGEIFQGERY